ncbi:caspase family protein [Anabaena catenula]|uniref:Caspase family protein n=1 Tax=Anabaena catenula FACHB-362 TaxID=2692877 RepID=A0ABR8J959_9NOST|nr:caspase family protein [Anabaena catenula]MBD2694911.1 caspase family protein [Anabaena catenula FACHB-362]
MNKFTHNLAIAIGINQYQNGIAKLNTAKPDAETLADILRDDYQYQVELITDADDTERKPTRNELENLLTKWLPEKLQQPAENNRLLFYFAGHGMALESDDGPRGFLLPQDANPKNPETFLSMQVLHDALIALPCHHLIVILDCCFAGTFRWASTRKLIPIPETIHREHYDRFIRYPAWQVITSAAHNQEALDFLSDKRGISQKSQGKKHSPFAEALFEALQDGEPDEKGRRYKKADLTKDGVITAPELYLYLRDNVENRSSDRQTPGLYPLKKHDRGEYIFHDPNFDPLSLSKADPIDETNNPYRGLKPFEEEHARFFFGRQELIESLYARIAAPDHSLTVVLGVSGSGKSSLVKAGLIPYLRELSKPNNNLNQWHILNPIRPGESPFAALARTIWAIADLPTTVQLDSLGFLSEKLNQKIKELQKIAEASKKQGETSRITQRLKLETEKFTQITAIWNQNSQTANQLLIVEHFETLYALCSTETEPESEQQLQLKQVFLACLHPLTVQLQSVSNCFVEIVKTWIQKHPGVKLLLVIDQFEELITLGRKAQPNQPSDAQEEWQQFLQLLETTLAATLPQLRIIVTLRSDFEPRFLNSEALKSYWTRARFPVRAMRSDELRQAIAAPASEMALYFEPANLVDRLIDEVGQMPGVLPLLSFTLSEFYIKLVQKWRNKETSDRALTIDADFDKEGGVAGSLTRKANEEYNKIGDELGVAAQITMRRVMLRMLTLEGGETARRRVPESELVYPTKEESDRVKQLIDRLVEARLLVKGQLETGEPYVEAAHDFLVRGWGTLQDWIEEEKAKETLELQQRLTAQANDWARNQGPLLPDGDRLNQLEKILKLSDNWLNHREKEFIERSIEYRDIQRKQARQLRVNAQLREKAANILDLLPAQPLNGLVLAIEAMGQNCEELPDEILSPVQSSLFEAMKVARERNVIRGHENFFVQSVAISADGQTIVSGSQDKTVRLWDRQGNPIGLTFQGHEAEVSAVAISPDGQTIVSGSWDSTVRLWDRQGNLIGQPFYGHNSIIIAITISADGQTIVSSSADRTARLWNRQGQSLTEPFTHEQSVTSVAISVDGQTIITGSADGKVRLWNRQGQSLTQPFGHEKESVNSVAISTDGQIIAIGSSDKTVKLWNRQGELLAPPFQGHEESVTSVAISTDGQTIISGSNDWTVRLWDRQGSLLSQPLRGHELGVVSIAVSDDGQIIISGSADGTVRLWDGQSQLLGNSIQDHEDEECITSVALSADGQIIATGSNNGTVQLHNQQGNPIGKPFESHNTYVTSVAMTPDGQTIVSGSWDNTVRLWNNQGNSIGQPFTGHELGVTSVAITPDGQTIVSGSADKTVRLWDRQGNPQGMPFLGHEHIIDSVAISADGQAIVSGSEDNTLRLWDRQGNPQGMPFLGHQDTVTSVAITLDGQIIVSGSRDRTLRLWDRQGNPIGKLFQGHKDTVTSVAITLDGQIIVSGSRDRTVRLWDRQGNPIGQPFQGHKDTVTSVAIASDGQIIASGSDDGTVRLWRVGNWETWLQIVCDRLRYHPIFKNPKSIEDIEQRKIAIAACETCRKYVWSQKDISV